MNQVRYFHILSLHLIIPLLLPTHFRGMARLLAVLAESPTCRTSERRCLPTSLILMPFNPPLLSHQLGAHFVEREVVVLVEDDGPDGFKARGKPG